MTEQSDTIPLTIELDGKRYAKYPDGELAEIKYGLPAEVRFCKRCVVSNQRPISAVEFRNKDSSDKTTIHFDGEGVCDACRVSDVKAQINWQARAAELRELCDRHRRADGGYDCIVPGSGGKDSFYTAHILKHEFGMHPLTTTWAPHVYTEWGWHNFQAWIHAGFDNYLITPDGLVHRLITRLAFERLFHPFQPFFIGQKNIAPRLALQLGIPLIFYGENEAEYGNPKSSFGSARKDFAYWSTTDTEHIYLGGASVNELVVDFGLNPSQLQLYLPLDPQRLEDANVEVHYLGYYLRWHPQSCYYYAVEHGGFQASPERTTGTYSKYASIDDKIDDLHYYTTFIKFGIGRATYDAAQEIRSGDITREEGVALVHRFDGEYPKRFLDELLAYLSIDEAHFGKAASMFEQPILDRAIFDGLTDEFRSPHLWMKSDEGWRLRYQVT